MPWKRFAAMAEVLEATLIDAGWLMAPKTKEEVSERHPGYSPGKAAACNRKSIVKRAKSVQRVQKDVVQDVGKLNGEDPTLNYAS
jgi:hypothetical protein